MGDYYRTIRKPKILQEKHELLKNPKNIKYFK